MNCKVLYRSNIFIPLDLWKKKSIFPNFTLGQLKLKAKFNRMSPVRIFLKHVSFLKYVKICVTQD